MSDENKLKVGIPFKGNEREYSRRYMELRRRNPDFVEAQNAKRRSKYANDPEFREAERLRKKESARKRRSAPASGGVETYV